ncbi:MAG: hemerythrin domain-containing protein [Candidatus Thiodiazotropha sp. (ex Dulcina madagascariensis)]|nr:hemerythrin domain-containing protein [Candidatus Thiodiazotropha sp. (ex Epidulcina cf. delphinae)]MCU7922176.1 hemerythrin domain-containing protein [Candidatus Thiodiazotropha sp. (ex Dulcina madagascariensis)]MCU7925365.1 hemerythrin domain-containing protein [Candidatus Thiodiazotropha sp. (ex Dulcina madagascariensis)]MCU7933773.1 hemerythrin domain-containing protein [Candidatus Thiodiazotropha sp. (ex Dulcina madagascariensis)]
MPKLIKAFDRRYRLGIEKLDEEHRKFVELVNRLESSENAVFIELFPQLVNHIQQHFLTENALMAESGYSAIHEHIDEHQRVLDELNRIGEKVSLGSVSMGRTYVTDHLPNWFEHHAETMDSALASHLKSRGFALA